MDTETIDEIEQKLNQFEDDDEHTAEPVAKKKRVSLEQLLSIARAADDYADECEIDLETLGADLRTKVDHIVEYIDYCNAKAKALKPRAEQLTKAAASYAKRAKDLREYVARCMHADAIAQGLEPGAKQKLPGLEYELELYYTETTEIKREPDAQLYLKHGGAKYIRRYYEWDAKAVKAALKEGREEFAHFAVIKQNPKIRIKLRK